MSSAAFLAMAAAAGCDLSTEPSGREGSGATRKGEQAPLLAQQVEAGALPPVEERLPEKPLVLEPTERVGTYGGTLQAGLSGTAINYVYTLAGYEHLVRWIERPVGKPGAEEIIPNVAESFEMSEDGTAFTFRLYPGMRWSDGEPFTADDVVFAVEDVLLNEEIRPVPPDLLTSADGGAARIEKLDDHSFRIVFPIPAGLFLQQLAMAGGERLTSYPRHHMEQFHQDYNPDVQQLAEEEGFPDWVELFGAKGPQGSRLAASEPDLPSLLAWQVITPYGDGSRVVLERNPYYWKVDPDGSQLPYIDRVVFDTGLEAEVGVLKISNGEINFEAPPENRWTTPKNKPILSGARDEGDFRFIDAISTRMNLADIQLNMTHVDTIKREVFENKDFRVGLSHAINRQEIIDVTLQGQAEPYQAAPLPDSPFYDEEFATQYLEYDVDRANEHLDRVLPERNADGIRLDSSGNPFSFTMELVVQWLPAWADIAELLKEYWRAVGIDMRYETREHTLFSTRADVSEHDGTMWLGDGGLPVLVKPHHYFPEHSQSFYARLWANWYMGGEPSEEPPEAPRRQMQLYDQVRSTVDPDEQVELMTQILDISKEQFYAIGLARPINQYFVAANDMRNVPNPMLADWDYVTPGRTHPEQFFVGQ